MTNLELADALQKEAEHFTGARDLSGILWDGGAALRNLHTENTALRVTEDNLRQELQECQDQRRAAFRRIEELDAMRAQIGKSESVASIWGAFPGYLIDNCEGETISEEGLQRALADMLSDQKYTHLAPQQALAVPGGGDGLAPLWIPTQPAPQQKPLDLSRLQPFVHGLGKAILAELMEDAAHNIGEKR